MDSKASMGRGIATRHQAQAQAHAQDQQQAIKSMTESLELVRCLLRVSIFHVAYLRGLFPDSFFKGTSMDAMDGMEIQMLRPKCKDSQRLVDWVERGVHDAIKKMYLSRLYFGVASNAEGTKLLEEYVFEFEYSITGGVSLKMTAAEGRDAASFGSQATNKSVRYQVTRLMRMLVELCHTLERIPEERYLFMKLAYTENTPEEYEPPYFQAEGDHEPAHFARKPFIMKVGAVATNFHSVTLSLKSTMDGEDDDPQDEPHLEQQASAMNPSTTYAGASGITMDLDKEADSQMQEVQSDPSVQLPELDPIAEKEDHSMPPVDLVKAYCLHRKEVDLNTTALHFTDIDTGDLSRAFDVLVIDGVLSKGAADRYKVKQTMKIPTENSEDASPSQTNPKPVPSPMQTGDILTGRAAKKVKQTVSNKKGDLGDDDGMESVQGRDSSMHGSMQSGQPSHMPPSGKCESTGGQAFFASQQSDGEGKKRKASFVMDPIHQNLQPAVTRQRSRLRTMCK